MSAANLWIIDREGRTFLVNLRDNSWTEVSTPELGSRNCFKRVSAVPQCAWAINANQQPCLYVHSTEVAIRVRVETWENQRWGFMNGWSEKSRFSSDRWGFSSEDGRTHLPKEDYRVPSDYWVWEGDWYIDRSIQGDIEGWQYAIDFPRKYYSEQSRSSCVRRRCWARYCKFDGFDRWLLIPGISEDPIKEPFQDLAIGGSAIPGVDPSYLAVWAVTFHGKVVHRTGIKDTNPEGDKWIQVASPPGSIIQLSVSRTGAVWGITWEGLAVVRTGITYDNLTGSDWAQVSPPSISTNPEANQLLQVSAGVNSIWGLTKDGQVWFRKGVNTGSAGSSTKDTTGSSWIQMVGRFLLIAVAPNDQVFALSTCGDHLYFRTDVKPDELSGRQWRIIKTSRSHDIDSSTSTVSSLDSQDSDEGYGGSPRHSTLPRNIEFLTWVACGACDVDASFFNDNHRGLLSSVSSMSISNLAFRDAAWRNDVLVALRSRDLKEVNAFESYEEAVSQGSWSKKIRCQMLVDANFNLWCDCVIKLDQGCKERHGALLCYYEKTSSHLTYGEMRIPLNEIKCVCIVSKLARSNCFAVHTPVRTFERNPLVIAMGSEKDLNDWVTTLSTSSARANSSEGPAPYKALWAITSCGDVFVSHAPVSEAEQPSHQFWHQIGGHLRHVEAGVSGVVWGIGFDGVPYVYSGGYGGGIFPGFASSTSCIYNQEDCDIHYIYENQRWNPIEGFSDRRLPSDRWVWSDKSGVYERTKEGYTLPSSQWHWTNQWQVDTRPGITDKEGWQYAVDFPRQYHPEKFLNDFVRRRKWKRRCKLTTSGPWLPVTPSVKLRDVTVQIKPLKKPNECVSVWVVGSKGDVLYRHGVTNECPQGKSWEHVITDVPFVSISIGGKGHVWGVAEDGTAYFRAGFEENKITGARWFHISERPPLLVQVSAGASSVWARDKDGTIWFRVNVTDTFPEGTAWKLQQGIVSHISAGPKDQVYMCHAGSIEKRYKVTQDNPIGVGWEITLPDHWWNVFCPYMVIMFI
ncbi:tectonin beta-propeller repeat-containing protein 1-like isoform X2 [Nematostella vectensis]|uniref:tectonin beta-propeller repeat-containing protein 1-like isoform X2 n=1 Tax=Nematostella vectensis TaxID=45351 RepID=UPI0020776DF9|nr:tectonin beta-propeller repeat-containing protein 1-like isoform X2 [Nematostella vectensis]